MDETTAPEDQTSQRTLAAIVFTDVVGFSLLASRDEESAIGAVRRDLAIMGNACKGHGGQVLKNTGDGLLMCFTSAVEALSCAVQIQNELAVIHQSAPNWLTLQHRIGVHLGDVIITPDDVYGDGVNIAARLQTEAKPDTIVFSRTVYDVVKGKMEVNATYLGPRTLKNLAEPVMLWQIASPALAMHQEEAMREAQESLEETPAPDPVVGGRKAVFYVLAAVVAMAVPIILWFTMFRPASKMPDIPHTGPTLMDKLRAQKNKDTPKTEPGTTAGAATTGTAEPETTGTAASPDAKQDPTFQAQRQEFIKSYNFAGLAAWLQSQGFSQKPGGPALIARYEGLALFMKWFESTVAATTKDRPIVGTNDPSIPGEYRVWAGQPGYIAYQTPTNKGEQTIATTSPRTLLAIAQAAAQKITTEGGVSDPAVAGWLTEFGKEFELE